MDHHYTAPLKNPNLIRLKAWLILSSHEYSFFFFFLKIKNTFVNYLLMSSAQIRIMMQNSMKMPFKCYLEDQNQTTESAIQASIAFHTNGIYMAKHFCSLPGFEEACPPASVWNRLWDVSAASLGFFCSCQNTHRPTHPRWPLCFPLTGIAGVFKCFCRVKWHQADDCIPLP